VDQPLFLDCCALVRRCVKDLRMDFGFQLKGGNQAYQFDTLPIRVESITDVRASLLSPPALWVTPQCSIRLAEHHGPNEEVVYVKILRL
jgi:hypothetical protein